MLDSVRRPSRSQVDRLFYLIALGFLGLVTIKAAVSTAKGLSDSDYWAASIGLVIMIVGVTVIQLLQRIFRTSRQSS